MEKVSRDISAAAADGKKRFKSQLKTEFVKSPLGSNVVLGLILVGFEKAVEVEFACPCNPTWNALFASAYFILPGVAVSLLMLVIKDLVPCLCRCKYNGFACACKHPLEWKDLLLFGTAPIIIWLELMFFDGRYFACAKTSWSGRFVIIDKADPQKWCEPDNSTSSMERMSQTQQLYFDSQGIGFIILMILVGLFMLYLIIKFIEYCCDGDTGTTQKTKQDEEEQSSHL